MKLKIAFLLCFFQFAANSQKYDYTWLAGYASNAGYDSNYGYWFGISKFDFNQQPATITYDSLGISFRGANCAVSNSNGELKFYTNGISVRNYLDEIIGDSLHDGYFLNSFEQWYRRGNPNATALVALPNPLYEGKFDLLYSFVDTLPFLPPGDIKVTKLLRAEVDMNENMEKGLVTYKDKCFYPQPASLCLNATRHGNGRDWWLISMAADSKCYIVCRYDGTDSIQALPEQCVNGFRYENLEWVTHIFSPNGEYLVCTNNEKGEIDLFNFDRCSGSLSLIEQINLPEVVDTPDYKVFGAAFSPNSRYVYICANRRTYQFDIQASPIASSKTIVGVSRYGATHNHAQLAPDGKIYISSRNGIYYMSVIEEPDVAGLSCNFQNWVQLPSVIAGLPYYPNYRLGALPGSSCDTLTSLGETEQPEKERLLKVFPNPATEFVTIDYGFTGWNKSGVGLEVVNNIGEIVYSQQLPMYSGFQQINVSHYSAGIYNVYIKRGSQVVSATKFAKQ